MLIPNQNQTFEIFDRKQLEVSLCADTNGELFLQFTGNFLLNVDIHRSDIRQAHTITLWKEEGSSASSFALAVFREAIESIVRRKIEQARKHDFSASTFWNLVSHDIQLAISTEKRRYLEYLFKQRQASRTLKKTG